MRDLYDNSGKLNKERFHPEIRHITRIDSIYMIDVLKNYGYFVTYWFNSPITFHLLNKHSTPDHKSENGSTKNKILSYTIMDLSSEYIPDELYYKAKKKAEADLSQGEYIDSDIKRTDNHPLSFERVLKSKYKDRYEKISEGNYADDPRIFELNVNGTLNLKYLTIEEYVKLPVELLRKSFMISIIPPSELLRKASKNEQKLKNVMEIVMKKLNGINVNYKYIVGTVLGWNFSSRIILILKEEFYIFNKFPQKGNFILYLGGSTP